jgi:hypothetical protein
MRSYYWKCGLYLRRAATVNNLEEDDGVIHAVLDAFELRAQHCMLKYSMCPAHV